MTAIVGCMAIPAVDVARRPTLVERTEEAGSPRESGRAVAPELEAQYDEFADDGGGGCAL